jgi:FlaA1/EpsC-like NDP-sugar epimerase
LPQVLVTYGLCFVLFGLYRGIWRFASIADLKRIAQAVAAGGVLVAMLALLARQNHFVVPVAVLILHPLMVAGLMATGRLAYRASKEALHPVGTPRDAGPLLVLGAGSTAVNLLRDFKRRDTWRVVGLLDDDPAKQGNTLSGVRVLGTWQDLAPVARDVGARHALLAISDADTATRARAVRLTEAAGIELLVPPTLDELMSGRYRATQIHKFGFADLLGRPPVQLDTAGLTHLLGGQCVLVTGAGGSIGAELTRQVARYGPARLVLFDQSEYALYSIEQELRRDFPPLNIVPLLGDVKDAARVEWVFATHQPAIVYHAAAYKHVPMLERDNAWEGIANNVHGTRVVARAAARAGTRKFVLISTDKAVNPANVMGATKRMAEMVVQATGEEGLDSVVVRFGNVLGSSGSVVPTFQEQIARGGPVLVTHPEVTRYFMTIPEAAQLVLQAGLMGSHGEIFVLDMGEPMRIVDLARMLIRLSGHHEDEIEIRFTGLRPGEKLHEELLAAQEETTATAHPKLRIARAAPVPHAWMTWVCAWLDAEPMRGDADVRLMMAQAIPEFAGAKPLDLPAQPPAPARAQASVVLLRR